MFRMIIPVYNTGEYLGEAIDSVINQSLPFKENVVLYLVDDASSDDSLVVCQKYEKQYPDNIVIIHFDENRGVSHVRNAALEECRKYPDSIVGFLDSDDRLETDALEKVACFLDSHEEINIAVTEIHYFEAREGENKLNWRFREKEVVDIHEDYTYPQYYIGGVFLRGNALQSIHFDEEMAFWEDAMAVNRIILAEERYGLVKDALYWYRRREDETSLVDRAWRDKERYTAFLENGYKRLMQYCRKEKHRIIPYIQFVVAYHLRLFMVKSNTEVVSEMLTGWELAAFRKKIRKILRKIKSEVIIHIPTSLPVVEAMLSIRSGRKIRVRRTYTEDDCIFSYRGYEITRMSQRKVRLFYIFDETDNPDYAGMWRGRFDTPIYQMSRDDYIFAINDGKRVDSVRYPCHKKIYILGEKIRNYKNAGFAIAIPDEWKSARFGIHTNGTDILMNEVVFAEVKTKRFSKKEEDDGENNS